MLMKLNLRTMIKFNSSIEIKLKIRLEPFLRIMEIEHWKPGRLKEKRELAFWGIRKIVSVRARKSIGTELLIFSARKRKRQKTK